MASWLLGAVAGPILGLLILALLTPVIQAAFSSLGLAWLTIILAAVGMAFLRGLFTLLLGRGAADRLIAHLAYDLVRLPFRMVARALGMAASRISLGLSLRDQDALRHVQGSSISPPRRKTATDEQSWRATRCPKSFT